MITLENVLYLIEIIFLVILLYSLIKYIPRIRAWFGSFKKQEVLSNEKKNNIALLIPARNESLVIKTLLDSLEAQTYDNYHAFVIVKENTDSTIDIVKNYRNTSVIVAAKQNCKGDALDIALKKIISDDSYDFDGFYIVDADCLLDKDNLKEMNNAMKSGCDVIQAKKLVKNYLSTNKKNVNWVTKCNGLIWTLIDDMGNRYKSDKGYTNMTIGTGILITKKVIYEIGGWPYRQTLTEDIEFMYDIVCKGYTTFYYSYAKIYLEESPSLHETNKRRARWMTGVVDSRRIYKDRIDSLERTPKIAKDIYYTTALAPAYVFVGSSFIVLLINLISSLVLFLRNNSLYILTLKFALGAFLIIYGAFLIVSIMAIIVDRKNIKIPFYQKVILALTHPFFYMGYIKIVTKAFFNLNTKKWEVIDRINDFDLAEDKNDK